MDGMTGGTPGRRNAGRQAVARYRQRNRRFDYSPSPEALAVIEHHRNTGTEPTLAGVLDMLVLAGHRAITGNQAGAGL